MLSPRHAAMNLLARREHSRLELENKLRRRYEKAEIAEVLDQLAADGLQSNERFALSYTRERMLRGFGPQKIAAELRQRGVDRRLADAAVATVPTEERLTWAALAVTALRRRFGDEAPATLEERARRVRYLHYRGFGEESAEVLGDV